MANPEHLAILKQGVETWNKWRRKNPDIQPNLREADLIGENLNEADFRGVNLIGAKLQGADLRKAKLRFADLREANLSGAYLSEANLSRANLSGTDLSKSHLDGAYLIEANLWGTNLSGTDLSKAYLNGADIGKANLSRADLSRAYLSEAYLSEANLSGANLEGTDLARAVLVGTNLEKANLLGCRIYGISAWGVKLKDTNQVNLIITPDNEPTITVDNLEVAQFIYLLLHNDKIRDVIDTISKKVVLILGRFTPERKAVLDAIRNQLRERKYVPVLFDFEKPLSKSFVETVSILAHLARFVIADVTDAKIVLQELEHIAQVKVAVVPLMLEGSGKEPVTLSDLRIDCSRLLPTYRYKDTQHLLATLDREVIAPAENKANQLDKEKAKQVLASK